MCCIEYLRQFTISPGVQTGVMGGIYLTNEGDLEYVDLVYVNNITCSETKNFHTWFLRTMEDVQMSIQTPQQIVHLLQGSKPRALCTMGIKRQGDLLPLEM